MLRSPSSMHEEPEHISTQMGRKTRTLVTAPAQQLLSHDGPCHAGISEHNGVLTARTVGTKRHSCDVAKPLQRNGPPGYPVSTAGVDHLTNCGAAALAATESRSIMSASVIRQTAAGRVWQESKASLHAAGSERGQDAERALREERAGDHMVAVLRLYSCLCRPD